MCSVPFFQPSLCQREYDFISNKHLDWRSCRPGHLPDNRPNTQPALFDFPYVNKKNYKVPSFHICTKPLEITGSLKLMQVLMIIVIFLSLPICPSLIKWFFLKRLCMPLITYFVAISFFDTIRRLRDKRSFMMVEKFKCPRTRIFGTILTPCIWNMLFILVLKYVLLILHVT